MSTRKTLADRCDDRDRRNPGPMGYTYEHHIRAEYDLLARRIRKAGKFEVWSDPRMDMAYKDAITDVIDLIKELKQ